MTNTGAGTVGVVDTATNTLLTSVPVGSGPFDVAVAPSSERVYVSNSSSGTVSVINATNNQAITSIPVGSGSDGIEVTPDGTRVYVANYTANSVSVIDTATNLVVDTVPDVAAAGGLAITPDGEKVWVATQVGGKVNLIDTSDNSLTTPVSGLLNPYGVAASPDGTKVLIADYSDFGNVSFIDTQLNAVSTTITGMSRPTGVAVTPDGSRAYVTNRGSNTVAMIGIQPSRPTSVTASAGNGTLSVNWQAPTFTGGQAITAYTATASPGGAGCVTDGTTECTIGGLSNGTAYTVTVTATNSLGTSAPSTSSNAATPTAPVTPTPEPTPTPSGKLTQKPLTARGLPPAAIKRKGVTRLTGRNARTNAGQLMTTTVKVRPKVAKYKVVRGPKGKVSLRTFGRVKLKVVLVHSAPATDTYLPYKKRTVYRITK